MGDPKRQRKKYQTPLHPWRRERLAEEKVLLREYGLKNKKELWKFESLLRKFKAQAKSLIAATTQQAKKEEKELLDKLKKLNLGKEGMNIDDVLGLSINDILDRRLQTLVYKFGLARSIKQARQFVVHGHVAIGDRVVNVPSYLVSIGEEVKIKFNDKSSLASEEHPERLKEKKKIEKEEVKEESKKEKKSEKKVEKKKEKKSEEKPKEIKKKEIKETKLEKKENDS